MEHLHFGIVQHIHTRIYADNDNEAHESIHPLFSGFRSTCAVTVRCSTFRNRGGCERSTIMCTLHIHPVGVRGGWAIEFSLLGTSHLSVRKFRRPFVCVRVFVSICELLGPAFDIIYDNRRNVFRI